MDKTLMALGDARKVAEDMGKAVEWAHTTHTLH